MSILHETHHPIRSAPLAQSQREPIPQSFNRPLPLEGGESSVEHQSNSIDELVGVRSQSEECFDGQMLEHGVTLRVSAAHENHHLVSKFEGVWFEFYASRPYVKQEPEIDVDYVTLSVNHDVSVMPILDLEDVTGDRVRSHRLNEVQPGLLEGDRMLSTIFPDEEIEQIVDFGPSHLIS